MHQLWLWIRDKRLRGFDLKITFENRCRYEIKTKHVSVNIKERIGNSINH